MSGPFIFIATNKVREGMLDEERHRIQEWARYIDENEPRAIAFHEYRSQDGTEIEFVQVHPDTDSFEHHLKVVAAQSGSYADTLEATTRIRIYGRPTEAILDMLAHTGAEVTVLPEHLGGFTR